VRHPLEKLASDNPPLRPPLTAAPATLPAQ